MTSLFDRLLQFVRPDFAGREVRRTVPHPTLGDLVFEGRRSPRDGMPHGVWYVTPPGFAHRLSLGLQMTAGDATPDPGELAWLEARLAEVDAIVERARPAIAPEYAHWVGGTLPADWRRAFRLEGFDMPNDEEPGEPWRITFWCEGAQHWFHVEHQGETVTDVVVDG
jgi:hypothetical protein